MHSVDIVTVSCLRDLKWLKLAISLLLKYWQHPESRIIVILDDECRGMVEEWGLGDRVLCVYMMPWADGYTFQMYVKMISDQFTKADLMLLSDSDLMLREPASLDTLMVDGKPILEYGQWGPVAERMWRGSTARVMGMDLPNDLMVGAPFLFWRDTFAATRDHIEKVTGKSFYEAVYSAVPFYPANFLNHPVTFSEHEALNLYASTFQKDRYHVRSNLERPPNWPWKLYWSYGDFEAARAELEPLL